MPATETAPVAAGLRWLATKRVTLGVVSLLLAVFAFELLVESVYGRAVWRYLFLANLDPSPGWLTAPFAHRNVSHLVTTLFVILVYGGLVEEFLPASTYFAFYVTAGYASMYAQLGAYLAGATGLGTLGASGAALGLVTLYTVRTATRHVHAGSVGPVRGAFAVSGTVIVALLLVNDFLPGVILTRGTAPFGHAGGALAGICVALLWPEGQSVDGTRERT